MSRTHHGDEITAERDFSQGCTEARNSRGETLPEYIETLRGVHAALRQDLFHAMGCKRKAKEVAVMAHYEKRVSSLSARLSECVKIARHYGVKLD